MISAKSFKEQVYTRQTKQLSEYEDTLQKAMLAYVDSCQDLQAEHVIYVKKVNKLDARPHLKTLMSQAGYLVKDIRLMDGALSYNGDNYKITFELPPEGE